MTNGKLPTSFWVVAAIALVWNLMGVAAFAMQVTMGEEALQAMSAAERDLYASIPAWATAAYAVAVFGGSLASIALLLRKAWAAPVFVVSLVGIVAQMGQALFMTRAIEVRGAGIVVMPLVVTAIAIFLVWYSASAKRKGWLG
jgi:hypothetical protein